MTGASIAVGDCLKSAQALLSCRPRGLITDVDGTISRIVDQPEMARVEARALEALRMLTPRVDLAAAVSGRPVAQILELLPIDGLSYVGNHGLEWRVAGQTEVLPAAQAYLPAIAATLQWLREHPGMPGVTVEDKGVTGAIHYRLSADPMAARLSILQALDHCPLARGLRITDGRLVVNILPPIRFDKGTAVEELVRSRRLRAAVYLGDDATDLDAFRALRALRDSGTCQTLRIAVASPEAPPDLLEEADCALEGVDEVVSFLELVAKAIASPRKAGK